MPDADYGSELVIRDKTTRYIALGIADSLVKDFPTIRAFFRPHCEHIRSWENVSEMQPKLEPLIEALESLVDKFSSSQKPILIQPIWKTVGQSSILAENCLDVFAWSNFGLTKLFIKTARRELYKDKITRPQRTILRLARFLWEVSSGNKVFQKPIYDDMTFGTLNDKEIAISGKQTNVIMRHERLTKPHFKRDVISRIILGGGEKLLQPERRFDAVIHYDKTLFGEKKT